MLLLLYIYVARMVQAMVAGLGRIPLCAGAAAWAWVMSAELVD